MFALKARPASLASRRSHTTRRSSQIVRVAEFERKTAEKMPKISVPAVDGGETPLSILNDGADAFAELVALNKPKQSVNRPQKVRSGRRGDGDVGEKSTNERREEGENRIGEWLDGMPTTEGVMMMRATLTLFSSPQFPTSKPPPTGGRLPPEPDVRGLLSFLDQGVQGGGPRGDRHGPAGALVSEIVVSIPRFVFLFALFAWPMPCLRAACVRGRGGIECRKKRDVLGHFRSARHPLYQHRGCSVRGGEGKRFGRRDGGGRRERFQFRSLNSSEERAAERCQAEVAKRGEKRSDKPPPPLTLDHPHLSPLFRRGKK